MKNWITSSRILYFIQGILLLHTGLIAQLSTPIANGVFGGRINGMSVISTGANASRIYIATESANSVFYADVTTTTSSETFGTFTVMPGLGSDDGYGSGISKLYAHQSSGFLFFLSNNNLYKTHSSGSTVSMVMGAPVNDVVIYGNYIFYIKGNDFYYAHIDGTGALGSTGSFTIPGISMPVIRVNPSNNLIYIASLTSSPAIYSSNVAYTALSASSSFSTLTLGTLSSSVSNWRAFGIGPDGTIFLGGDDNANKYVQYSTNDGSTWSGGSTLTGGIGGPNFSFGHSSPYTVCFANVYATFTTATGIGTWNVFGSVSSETHPNDGTSCVDPNNDKIIYVTTDQGIGATKNGGTVLFEIDNGVEAIQVNDFSMKSDKTMAYLASKAGIRKVTSFTTTPVWTNAMFPNGDGSPYYSAEMENDNDAVAYVGNVRVYKTSNSGTTWTSVLSEVTTSYSPIGTRAEAIEVCPTNNNLVLAGFYIDGATQGGLWYSTNAGATWTQLQLRTTGTIALPNDVDVNDIAFTTEGGNAVAYIGVYYNLSEISTPADRGYSIYRAEWSGSAWTVREDMQGAYTSTGAVIVVSIKDIEVASSGTMIYACGNDAGTNHPVAFYKDLSAGTPKWTVMPVSGFPSGTQTGKAIASGGGNVYCAADNVVYTIPESGGTTWSVGYTYPAGTEINVLFYDALLVGTGTGLYSQTKLLPVELSSFTLSVIGGRVELHWKTATEVNNYGFALERRSGSDEWAQIAFVRGSGTSNVQHLYSYSDVPLGSGKAAYRLKQIDLDGNYEYSNIIEAELSAPVSYMLAQNFPNPFNPSTTINYSIPRAMEVNILIYDVLGNIVSQVLREFQQQGNYSISVDGASLSSGTYFYVLRTGDFVKMKQMLLLK